MQHSEKLWCAEFQSIVHNILDGVEHSQAIRDQVRHHRDDCESCSNYQDHMIQIAAISGELLLPPEYLPADPDALWQQIFDSVGPKKNLFNLEDTDVDDIFGKCMVRKPQVQRVGSTPDLGRLDATKIDEDGPVGSIVDIGKFLFDPSEVHLFAGLIERSGDSDVYRISIEEDVALSNLLQLLGQHKAIAGSILLAPDGTLISSRLREGSDSQLLSIWSMCSYLNAQAACRAFGHNTVNQIVSRSEMGYVILAKVQKLMLVTLVDGQQNDLFEALQRIGMFSQ